MNITLLMLGKLFIDISFLGSFIWTLELFPIVIRLQGWAICSIIEKTGIFTAPFISSVLQRVNHNLPYIIVVCLAPLAAAVGLVLPETNKKPTRERFEDFFENSLQTPRGPSETPRDPSETSRDLDETVCESTELISRYW